MEVFAQILTVIGAFTLAYGAMWFVAWLDR